MIKGVAYKHLSLIYTCGKSLQYLVDGLRQFTGVYPVIYVYCRPYRSSLAKFQLSAFGVQYPCTCFLSNLRKFLLTQFTCASVSSTVVITGVTSPLASSSTQSTQMLHMPVAMSVSPILPDPCTSTLFCPTPAVLTCRSPSCVGSSRTNELAVNALLFPLTPGVNYD